MRRSELEHLIRAASAITDQYEIVVIDSQSILGAVPDAPASPLQSMEADLYPLHRPDLADLIDGTIGELSPFEDRFGYYPQGVGPETAILPAEWETRLVKIQNANADLKIGYCLEPHDLAAAKLAAGRDKDRDFAQVLLQHDIVQTQTLLQRIGLLPLAPERLVALQRWVLRSTPGNQSKADDLG